jgi:S1/P1 Nuclease
VAYQRLTPTTKRRVRALLKLNPHYQKWLGQIPAGNRPDGASSSQNIGYSDHLHHKYWYFVDRPFNQDGSPLPAIPALNAETQISTFRAVLGTNPTNDVKSYDLVWLLHLVGDVHQPLHSSTPGTGSNPNTAVAYAKKLPPVDAALGSDVNAATWIKESFDDAQTMVYVAPIGAGDGPFTTTAAYRAAARTVAKERVALAGVRLANLLNVELK